VPRIGCGGGGVVVVVVNTATNNTWMATGIKASCKHKTELYLTSRDDHEPLQAILQSFVKCHFGS
jgi:hypothetical protein